MTRARNSRRSRREGEQGQALVLFVIVLVLLLTTVGLVLNGGTLRRNSQELWNATDAGALAGAASLPMNATTAASDARKFSLANLPTLARGTTTITFRCLVGDRNNDGRPDAADIPAVCNPGSSATWTCTGGKCFANCDPARGHVCNTVVVAASIPVGYWLNDVTNVDGATVTHTSAACSGLCGADPAVPLDIGFIIDRTSSMSDADLTNVKNATLSTLRILDPNLQRIGLAVLGRSRTDSSCSGSGSPKGIASLIADVGTWVTNPYPTTGTLSSDYLTGTGAINTSSQLVRTINCLDHSSTGTNLGDPVKQMADVLVARGRAGVAKGIIFMTDGAANEPDWRSCKYANDKATAVKAMGIQLYTIGFGVVGDRCIDIDGTYRWALAADLLADMATGPTDNDGCTDAENSDGDHFFCEPRSDSLTAVFRAATTGLIAGNVKLVQLPGT
jgi:hypothetical protein